MENVEEVTPYSRQEKAPAIHYHAKRQGFHALQPTGGGPSDTLPSKTSRVSGLTAGGLSDTLPGKTSRNSRLTADRRKPQRYITMENVEDFTPYWVSEGGGVLKLVAALWSRRFKAQNGVLMLETVAAQEVYDDYCGYDERR
jgi:hypothetical protein